MAPHIIHDGPASEELSVDIRDRLLRALPGAGVDVRSGGPVHFEIRVCSDLLDGSGRVAQQHIVYRAITDLMTGPDAPVHAIDRLECVTPETSAPPS